MSNRERSESGGRRIGEFDDRKPSNAVVSSVAAAEGVRPPNLDAMLYEAIEPDALDELFAERPRPVNVTFEFCGHEVVVEREGRVVVR